MSEVVTKQEAKKQQEQEIERKQEEVRKQQIVEAKKQQELRVQALPKPIIDAPLDDVNVPDYALKTIYFDFDKSEPAPEYMDVLQKNYSWIKNHPDFKIRIEGHADERGSTEYNLALGEKRAQSIFSYLQDFGVDPAQFYLLSLGEEHPADPGHSSSAWAKNRRVEFVR
ncbi:MAG: OmpA family protein [SAR324 cluster bacterium]|nr:OmpA family protein [SAR324 cluster bacterium]